VAVAIEDISDARGAVTIGKLRTDIQFFVLAQSVPPLEEQYLLKSGLSLSLRYDNRFV
jgi:hypothetical protein